MRVFFSVPEHPLRTYHTHPILGETLVQRGSLAGASIPSLAWVPTLARPPTSPAWDPRWRASTLVSVSTHIFLQKSEIHLMFLIQYLQKVFENSDFWEISMLKRSNTT
jgi:hypothetical protein